MAINGTNYVLYIESGASNIVVGGGKSLSFSPSAEDIDITSKDTGEWGDSINGRKSWTASADSINFKDDSAWGYPELYAYFVNGTSVVIKAALKESIEQTGDVYLEGTAKISSLPVNFNDNEAVNFTIEFTGKGALEVKRAV